MLDYLARSSFFVDFVLGPPTKTIFLSALYEMVFVTVDKELFFFEFNLEALL